MRRMLSVLACVVGFVMAGSVVRAAGDDLPPNFTVNVHDLANKPISGAAVSVQVGRASQEAFTDDSGAAHVNVDLSKARSVSAKVNSSGYAGVQKYWTKRGATDAVPDHLDVVMDKDQTISGRVLDSDGKPLEGAKVMIDIQKKYPGGNERDQVDYTTAIADAEGKWSFGGVPATFDEIELGASDKHCLSQYGFTEMTKWDNLKGLQDGTAVLTLKRGTPVHVSVVDQDGQPLQGVRVGFGQDRVASNSLPEEKTAADGTVELGVQSGNTAVLTFLMKGYAPELVRRDIGDAAVDVKVTMKPGQILEGTVKDPSGKPVKGATVFVDTWREARTIQARIQTDGTGHFVWPDAPEDEVKVDVLSSKGEKRGVVMKAGEENVVSLVGATTFKGTVVDAETGQPVTDYKIMLGIDFKQDGRSQLSWENNSGSDQIHPTGGTFDVTFSYPYPARAVRVIAGDYLPADSDEFPMQGQTVEYTFKLKRGTPIKGVLLDGQGKPVGNAQIVMLSAGQNIGVENGQLQEWNLRESIASTTKADGTYSFGPQKDDYTLLAVTDAGYAQLTKAGMDKGEKLALHPWVKLEGEIYEGTKPLADTMLRASPMMTSVDGNQPRVFFNYSAKSDGQGKFVFERLPAGNISVSRQVEAGPNRIMFASQKQVTVKEGEVGHIRIGGVGRPITGHVAAPGGYAEGSYLFGDGTVRDGDETPYTSPKFSVPDEVLKKPREERMKWVQDFMKSDEGKKLREEAMAKNRNRIFAGNFKVQADGSFRVADVEEGVHTVTVTITDTTPRNQWERGTPIATATVTFTMPQVPGGVSDEPLDVGTLQPKKFAGKVGDEAADLAVKTLDGKDWKLSDQKGKTVFVFPWELYYSSGGITDAMLANIWKTYGANDKFAMIAITGRYGGPEDVQRYFKLQPVDWPVAVLDEATSKTFGDGYNRAAPCLIGPDGKLLAVNMMGENVEKKIAEAMKAAP